MPPERSAKFLDLIRRSQRGRLKIYLGYGPGVGKTFAMLQEAHRLKREGIDVVVGLVETHGRADTQALVDGLEVLPCRKTEYHGIAVEEFDLDACIQRRPQVVIVDELAHTNVPGSKNLKRYEDVQELLAAGVHVISAMNVQHLESLYNTVETLVGVKVRERVPDAVLADADQVVNVDVAPDDLQKRLRAGKIYPSERVAASLENFFQEGNLQYLRELTLRELAGQIDARRREQSGPSAAGGHDQIMVCLSSRGPSSARLLRFASRLAGRLNRTWYAVYVQTPNEDPLRIDARVQRLLADTLTLANQLGATVFTFKGEDIAQTIVRFAREYGVGQIVIGKPQRPAWHRRLLGRKSVAEQLLYQAENANVIVVDAESEEQLASDLPPAPASDQGRVIQVNSDPRNPLQALVDPDRLLVYPTAVRRDVVLGDLAALIARKNPAVRSPDIIEKLAQRELLGSTFLNGGIALPHARVEGLTQPEIAMAVTQGGITDPAAANRIEVVFLLVSPASDPSQHLRALSAAGKLFRDRDARTHLATAHDSVEAAQVIAASLSQSQQ